MDPDFTSKFIFVEVVGGQPVMG